MGDQLCDICGRPMKLVRQRRVGAGKGMGHGTTTERTYACGCGEWLKVRQGRITAAKWFDVTFSYPSWVQARAESGLFAGGAAMTSRARG